MSEFIKFQCRCGYSIRSATKNAGRWGMCKKCNRKIQVPVQSLVVGADLNDTPNPPTKSNGTLNSSGSADHPMSDISTLVDVDHSSMDRPSNTIEQMCGICHTPIVPADESTACSSCSLPFHTECWEENLGCAAYGCSNVNILKTAPDIIVPKPPMLPPPPGSYQRPTCDDSIPWGLLLFAATAMGVLLSLFCWGIPSLITGIGALIFEKLDKHHQPSWIATINGLISILGFCLGRAISSFIYGT